MKKQVQIYEKWWFGVLICALLLGLICFFPKWFTEGSILDFTETGQIGDTIGGIMGPFVAIVAAFLTFIAFWVQKKANDAQRQDIKVERFNANFYNLLTIHEQITDSLEYRVPNTSIEYRGRNVFYETFENTIEHHTGINSNDNGMREIIRQLGDKGYVCSDVPTHFDHYFRNLYRIVKYVDETEVFDYDEVETNIEKVKYRYVAILRSTLSRYELIWLFYNGLSEYGRDKFKPLIEKYALLKNIRYDFLVDLDDIKRYDAKAYGGKYPMQ